MHCIVCSRCSGRSSKRKIDLVLPATASEPESPVVTSPTRRRRSNFHQNCLKSVLLFQGAMVWKSTMAYSTYIINLTDTDVVRCEYSIASVVAVRDKNTCNLF